MLTDIDIQKFPLGSIERLEVIESSNLEVQSEAAKRCLNKRGRRREFMHMGMTYHIACLVVNQENGR